MKLREPGLYRKLQVVYNYQSVELVIDGGKDSDSEVGRWHRVGWDIGRKSLGEKEDWDDKGGWRSEGRLETL